MSPTIITRFVALAVLCGLIPTLASCGAAGEFAEFMVALDGELSEDRYTKNPGDLLLVGTWRHGTASGVEGSDGDLWVFDPGGGFVVRTRLPDGRYEGTLGAYEWLHDAESLVLLLPDAPPTEYQVQQLTQDILLLGGTEGTQEVFYRDQDHTDGSR